LSVQRIDPQALLDQLESGVEFEVGPATLVASNVVDFVMIVVDIELHLSAPWQPLIPRSRTSRTAASLNSLRVAFAPCPASSSVMAPKLGVRETGCRPVLRRFRFTRPVAVAPRYRLPVGGAGNPLAAREALRI
jgi:hypothetical protein